MKLFRIATVPISLNILLNGQLRFLNRYFEVTAVSGSGTDLESVADREGVKTHSLRIKRKISIIEDIVSLFKLYFYFRKEKPLIIHSITPKAGLLSMIAGKWAGVPIRMHTFTGLIFPYRTGLLRIVLIRMDRVLCRYATHVYPEGNGVKEDLIRYAITQKKLKVMADGNVNGIDTEYFSRGAISDNTKKSLRDELGISEDDFVFIFVGRLVKDKGINELVAAFRNVLAGTKGKGEGVFPEGKAGIKLLLVGPLEPKQDKLLKSTLSEMKVNTNIILAGFQPDVRPYFAISDALAFPSYREGFPNVVLQAGAMELPAIVTDISGCNEIISHGHNGLCVPAKNIPELEKTMLQLLRDTEQFSQMQQAARPLIESRYRQALVWKALLEEYHANVAALSPEPEPAAVNNVV
ncbi:glycosyltransferase family 4 protein [Kaistella sp. DKR-2]|uniref:glycosyltransferase family 4 protein n=1 Tax=Kaistella soli TaxID=2849654 RepID=UPI001C26076B|nr:glycosyltransferase family 4 protein [Kaistella soli]MBU8883057.1 glycosyltransferase family 4 protein [Kaistella soli]